MTGFIQYLDETCNYNPNPFLVTPNKNDLSKEKVCYTPELGEVAHLSPKSLKQPEARVKFPDSEVPRYHNKLFKNPEGLKERCVFERLTDHRFFTGSHRERFDENGRGRGLAGRENLYFFDGNTESYSRVHEVYSSVLPRQRRPMVPPNTLGVKKFGVQIEPPKLVWLYRNGDKHHDGVSFYIRPYIRTMKTLLIEIGKELTLIAGPVRKIYDQNLRPVTQLDDFVDGAKYLCTSGEPPASPEKLEKFMSEWVIQKLF
ncbi:uncharacterized protein TA07545 [Theileria annulata]|uniref:Doublecortin domain-containing protein n=1 Tax=Theileria annulata TaxID=5874 RepID=Q4UA39_THEAN|nr:uncharacterized protein TA07545 [Theileria annulata]CAI76314.1 hypothetical protein, conserved [Theileria annulata]|eukprot:XP_952938.1 hypothetical protein, conserved [Theileria annulata]